MASRDCVCWDYETPDVECTCGAVEPKKPAKRKPILWHAVDQQGHVLVTYRTYEDALTSLFANRTRQARAGLTPGELDYKTVNIREAR